MTGKCRTFISLLHYCHTNVAILFPQQLCEENGNLRAWKENPAATLNMGRADAEMRVPAGSKLLYSVHNFLVLISLTGFLCNEKQNVMERRRTCWAWLLWGRITLCLSCPCCLLACFTSCEATYPILSPAARKMTAAVCMLVCGCVFKLSLLCVWWEHAKHVTKTRINKNNYSVCSSLFYTRVECACRLGWCSWAVQSLELCSALPWHWCLVI